MTANVLDIEAAVRALLVADTTVYNYVHGRLIGAPGVTTVGDRIYPDQVEQGSLMPAIVYFEVSERKAETANGPGISTVRLQLDCYAATRTEALSVIGAVDSCLCPRRDTGLFNRIVTLNDGSRVNVQAVRPDIRRSSFEQATKLHRRGRDYFVTASAA